MPAYRVVRRNERNQITPRNHLFHLFEELAFARFLEVEIDVQSGLFHATYFIANGCLLQQNYWGFAEFPLHDLKSSLAYQDPSHLSNVNSEKHEARRLGFRRSRGLLLGALPLGRCRNHARCIRQRRKNQVENQLTK